MRSTSKWIISGLVSALLAACSSENNNGTGGGAPTSGATTTTTTTGMGGDLFGGSMSTGMGGGPPPCDTGDEEDWDKDGFTKKAGDCNDCNKDVHPGGAELPTEPGAWAYDDDCDGKVDNLPTCDDNLKLDDADPLNAAKSVELCKQAADAPDWGLVSATWTLPDGSPTPPTQVDMVKCPTDPAKLAANYHLGHGILPDFGPNVHPQAGQRVLALSSGTARRPKDPGYKSVEGFCKGYLTDSPAGFPKPAPSCPTTGTPRDGVALEVKVRAPNNAHGFGFNFNFYTYEWPEYVCSAYNDVFVAMLSPIPKGQVDGNITFDKQGNAVTVNNAFLEVCGCPGEPAKPPCKTCTAGNKCFACSLGIAPLDGTGFLDQFGKPHGATGWLITRAPVDPGEEITLRWTIYDSGDGILDSSTLIDNWQWLGEGAELGTNSVPTPK